MGKLGTNVLQKLLETIDESNLSYSKRETIKSLVNAELIRRQGDQLEEFQQWIKAGDAIIEKAKKELQMLRAATSQDSQLVSLSSVLNILQELQNKSPERPYDMGQNWALQKAAAEIEKLPRQVRAPSPVPTASSQPPSEKR